MIIFTLFINEFLTIKLVPILQVVLQIFSYILISIILVKSCSFTEYMYILYYWQMFMVQMNICCTYIYYMNQVDIADSPVTTNG